MGDVMNANVKVEPQPCTRLLAEFKRNQFIKLRGSILLVRNRSGLQSQISS